jgi:hypothetical protein
MSNPAAIGRASRFTNAKVGASPDRSCDVTILVGPMGIGKTYFLSTIVAENGGPIFIVPLEKGGLKGKSPDHSPAKFEDAMGRDIVPRNFEELIQALQAFRQLNVKTPPEGWAAGDGPEETILRAMLETYPAGTPAQSLLTRSGLTPKDFEATMVGLKTLGRVDIRPADGWRLVPQRDWQRPHLHFGIDSLSAMEELVHRAVLGANFVESMADKEYNELFTRAIGLWRQVRSELEEIRSSGVHVWITAHAADSFADSKTSGETFRRADINLRGTGKVLIEIMQFWVGWADNVLHLAHRVAVTKGGKGKLTTASIQATLLYTRISGAFNAKSRHRVPDTVPATFTDWKAAVRKAQPAPTAILRKKIAALLPSIHDDVRPEIEAALAKSTDSALAGLLQRAAGLVSVAGQDVEDAADDEQGAPAKDAAPLKPATAEKTDAPPERLPGEDE